MVFPNRMPVRDALLIQFQDDEYILEAFYLVLQPAWFLNICSLNIFGFSVNSVCLKIYKFHGFVNKL